MSSKPAATQPRRGQLVLLERRIDPDELVEGLKAARPWAQRTLIAEHGSYVERVLTRVLGRHADIDDLVQEVFIRALRRVERVDDASGLRSWLGSFAVFVARETIRKRRRWRWLVFTSPEEIPDVPGPEPDAEARAAVRAYYRLLERMEVDLRIAYTLRVLDGMELTEVAELIDVSLSTAKRRVRRARAWVTEQAAKDPELADWVGSGDD